MVNFDSFGFDDSYTQSHLVFDSLDFDVDKVGRFSCLLIFLLLQNFAFSRCAFVCVIFVLTIVFDIYSFYIAWTTARNWWVAKRNLNFFSGNAKNLEYRILIIVLLQSLSFAFILLFYVCETMLYLQWNGYVCVNNLNSYYKLFSDLGGDTKIFSSYQRIWKLFQSLSVYYVQFAAEERNACIASFEEETPSVIPNTILFVWLVTYMNVVLINTSIIVLKKIIAMWILDTNKISEPKIFDIISTASRTSREIRLSLIFFVNLYPLF